MEIRIRETGQVVTETEFRQMFPSTSFPTLMTQGLVDSFGGDIIVEGTYPIASPFQVVAKDGVEKIGDSWHTKYVLIDVDNEARSTIIDSRWNVIRMMRNEKLSETDWTRLDDAPVDKEAWAEYRQALRDITTQEDPFNIVWPTPPQ